MIPKAKEETTESGAKVYKLAKKGDVQEYVEIGLMKFIDNFKNTNYGVEQIELWIEAKAETSNLTKLFVSAGATGGCKIILEPKN